MQMGVTKLTVPSHSFANEMVVTYLTHGGGRGSYRVLVGKPDSMRQIWKTDLNGRIMLKWIVMTWDGRA
jgi:hypothetical protein